ncbi:MAG: hypothetical protein IPM29_27620 [Planctomycetes bacterium]|nr:hypothetical protein [Planctomycetota bacterium]
MRSIPFVVSLALAAAAALPAQSVPCFDTSPNNVFDDNISMGGPNLLYAVKFNSGAGLAVFAAEVFSGERVATASLGIWSHDAVNNRPQQDLGTGTWQMTQLDCWQGALLPSPVLLAPNTDFWIVFGPPNGAQSPIERVNTASTQQYRGSFDGGQSWNGPFVRYDHKFRLYCGPKFPGSFITLGSYCPLGSRTLNPRIAGCIATIGGSLDLTLTRGEANTTAVLAIGFSDTVTSGGVPLPIDLTPIGATSCSLFIDVQASGTAMTNGSGNASFSLPVPAIPAIVGNPVFAQWFQLSPGTNPLGLIASDYGVAVIGD